MEHVIALIALTAMEIVLGIDNIVFIVILTGRLPEHQQKHGRQAGLLAAMCMRVVLLLFLNTVLTHMQAPFFHLSSLGIPDAWMVGHEEVNGVSVRDVVLLLGGLFLIGKSVFEVHEKMEGHESQVEVQKHPSFSSVILQIMILDIVFSLDSVITAVGMAESIWVMVAAVIIAVLVMLVFSEPISRFVQENPTLKMLALSFLILIGVVLVAEGSGVELNKGYIYFAMAFSLIVEFLNIRVRRISTRRAARKAAT